MTPHEEFFATCLNAARAAGHLYPEMAACEAALESAWGSSQLARSANNLFGMKQHQHPIFGTLSLPTREFIGVDKERQMTVQDGKLDGWIATSADWVKYPDFVSCFRDRMATLQRLAPKFPHYAAALSAKTGEEFVREVSQTWSTDPHRADKVLMINRARLGLELK